MNRQTFVDCYCMRQGITAAQYSRHLLYRVLYPHAWLFLPVILLVDRTYLAADFDFIHDVGKITSYPEFFGSVSEFLHHPGNRGLLRRLLRLRVSTERMKRIVRQTLRTDAGR